MTTAICLQKMSAYCALYHDLIKFASRVGMRYAHTSGGFPPKALIWEDVYKYAKNNQRTQGRENGKIKYKYIKTGLSPGEIVEIGVKYMPGAVKNKRYYQFTSTGVASRRRRLEAWTNRQIIVPLLIA